MLRVVPLLLLPVLAGMALAPARAQAQGGPADQMTKARLYANSLGKQLRVLREDIDIDLPDQRGEQLGAVVDLSVQEVRQLQRGIKAGLQPAQLHKIVVDLDKHLDQLVAVATKLGPDGYYLRKLALQINGQNEALAQTLAPFRISPNVFTLTDQITKSLAVLRDDIDVDLPDQRGQALVRFTDQTREKAFRIFRGARFGVPPDQLQRQALELTQYLEALTTATKKLGTDGYYLHQSSARIQPLGLELVKSLGTP